MIPVFLIGGGWRAEIFPQTYGRFLDSATRGGERRIAIVVAEEKGADSHAQFLRFHDAFEAAGLNAEEAFETIVSAEKNLTKEVLAEINPTGIFVCGGLTPAYADALCVNKTWLEYLIENEIPYCGFSAGAAIAAQRAIIGGWQRNVDERIVEIANENAGEDLDLLDVRDGLGLVPFAVDVHATQWGTLSRLIHTIDANLATEGFAIDENTMLEIKDSDVQVHGSGNSYHAKRINNRVVVEVFQSSHGRLKFN